MQLILQKSTQLLTVSTAEEMLTQSYTSGPGRMGEVQKAAIEHRGIRTEKPGESSSFGFALIGRPGGW